MRARQWANIWLVVVVTTVAALGLPVQARAQYDDGLPAEVQQVTVDDQPIDASTVPQATSRSPVFAGRLTPGPESVELGLGNGDVTRFELEVDPESGRFRGNAPDPLDPGTYALYVDDALVGEFVVVEDAATAAAGSPVAAAAGAALDLARLVPFPADFADAVPGLGLVRVESRYFTALDQARASAAPDASEDEIAQAAEGLAGSGFPRYQNLLAVPNAGDPTRFDVQVSSVLYEYPDAATAASAFDGYRQDGTPVDDAPTIGEGSRLSRRSDVATQTGAAYQALELAFHQDRLLGVIVLADLRNREPEQAVLEAAGEATAGRIAAAVGADAAGLSAQALRLDLGGATEATVTEAYEAVDGELVPLFEEEDASAARAATFAGASDVYAATFSGTVVPGARRGRAATPTAATEGGAEFGYAVTLYGFPDESAADEWLAGIDDRLGADQLPGYLSFSPVEDAPSAGDGSATYAFSRQLDEATAGGFRSYVRVGDRVAEVEFAAVPEAPLASVQGLVEAQVACLEAGACPDPAPIPGQRGANAAGEAASTAGAAAPAEADAADPEGTPERRPRRDRERPARPDRPDRTPRPTPDAAAEVGT